MRLHADPRCWASPLLSEMLRDKLSSRPTFGPASTASIPATPSSRLRNATARTRRAHPSKSTLCSPLDSTDALLSWRPNASAARCVSRVPLPDSAVARYVRPSTLSGNNQLNSTTSKRIQPPRLLMCHDFATSYPVHEASTDGVSGSDCPPDKDIWRFNHWAYVDVFVYASSHRVVIPPVGYIHAAHRHSALILGTLHFGLDDKDASDQLIAVMSNFSARSRAVSQLATIAKFFGFDGWFVRIQFVPEQVSTSDIAGFVNDLTRACRKALGPAAEVVWFDSITRKGDSKPQCELNEENDLFFKAAGAFFTSFRWTRNAPVRSAVKAGPRRTDVFTGIDVFGRRTFGGGGFQTHIALRAIKQAGTSAAIFAPSWTTERCPHGTDPLEVEERFWTGPRGRFGRECVAQYFKERAVLTQLPFSTSFDPGWGPRTVSAGNVVSEEKYFNMKRQDVQPSFLRTKMASGDGAAATLALSHEQALNGSASIRFSFSFSESRMLSGTYSLLRLFVAKVTFPKVPTRGATHGYTPGSCLKVSYQYFVDDHGNALRPSASLNRTRGYNPYDDDEGTGDPSIDQVARDTGANQFGLLLLFAAPMRAILLVGENSRWYAGAEEGAQRAMSRLEILEKYVDYTAIAPAVEEPVRSSPLRADGSPTWMNRTFELPSRLISGQRLQEVMVIVGDPPLQPISVRPSPLVTPTSHSRVQSIRQSRVGSGMQSPMSQGQLSVTRKSVSLRGNRNPRTRIGAELLNAGLLAEDRPGPRRMSQSTMTSVRRLSVRTQSGLTEDGTDNSSDFGSEPSDSLSQKSSQSFRTLKSRTSHAAAINAGYRRQSNIRESRHTRMNDLEYASNFSVDGTVDFSHMQADVLNRSGSRAISRFGSRIGSPDSGHSMRLSRYSSRNNSRMGSRNPSRAMSPTGMSGGGALRVYSGRYAALEERRFGRSESIRSVGGSSVLAELKSNLMMAADSMAAGGELLEGGVSAMNQQKKRGGVPRGMQRVFLGGLSMEVVDEHLSY